MAGVCMGCLHMAGITEMNAEAADSVPATDSKDAILLIAHGSTTYPLAARPTEAQLARLAATDPARPVALGLLNGTPTVAQALAALQVPRIRAVPFFMDDGWFTRVAIPSAVGGDPRVVLCPPIGVHPGMAGLIVDRVHHGCAERGLDPAATAVLIVGHGSARAPGRTMVLHRHAEVVTAAHAFATVRAAYLEEPPLLADALAALRQWPVAVVGFFAGNGGHVRIDLPAAVQYEETARGPGAPAVHNFGAVVESPALTQIILDQAASV
jgi:sirohydrochlorin cobaltochelatase